MEGTRAVLDEGLSEGVFPGAVLLVARQGRVVFFEEVGHRSLIPERAPMDKGTVFDLASLTKVCATTLAVMKLVDEGRVGLDRSLGELMASANLGDKKDLTPRLLLTHSAGLADWKPFYEDLVHYPMEERKRVLREWIVREPYAYEPGKGSLYSDLGFMLIEWVIEEKGGERLDRFVDRHFYGPLRLERTFFSGNRPRPLSSSSSPAEGGHASQPGIERWGRDRGEGRVGVPAFAATEDCPWRKRVLRGEVHDENAFALGGVSAHAGLFSTAQEVYAVVNMLREHYRGERNDFFTSGTVREFWRRQDIVDGSDWALGWDTRALVGSSAGTCFSRNSVGHTGFTGTSVWIDLEKDVTAILLTNRVHPTRGGPEKMKAFRSKIHDRIMQELGLARD